MRNTPMMPRPADTYDGYGKSKPGDRPVNGNHRTAPGLIEARVNFKCTNMSGEAVRPGSHRGAGELPAYEAQRFFAESDRIDYIVYSYATPIAWHRTDGTWHKVSHRFTATTNKHQGRLYLI